MVGMQELPEIMPQDPPAFQPVDAGYYTHLCLLVGAVMVLVMSFFMSTRGTSLVYLPGFTPPLPVTCASRLVLGMECPACGLTRAFIAISHGEIHQAWRFNPAGFLVYLFVLIQVPWQTMQMIRIRRGQRPWEAWWYFFFPLAIGMALLLQWTIRIAIHS